VTYPSDDLYPDNDDLLVHRPDVVAALVRPLKPEEAASIDALMVQVSSRLRTRMPSVDVRIAAFYQRPRPANALDPITVASMLAGVIKRYLVNVEGAASRSRTDGPFTTTFSFASYGKTLGEGTPGELEITDADIAALTAASGRRRLGSIRLGAGLSPEGIAGQCL
jgi:hypothetical protein